jgi:hypothetical protein
MYNLYLTKILEEPDAVLALRLVYWYSSCKHLTDSFRHKGNEVRYKLTKGLLNQREKINKQFDGDLNENTTALNEAVSEWETMFKDKVSNRDILDRADAYRQQFNKDIWNVTSKLLLAGFCGVSGFDISFVPPSKEHDYDFIINGYPVQVKSLNTPDFVSAMAIAKRQRKDNVDSNQITYTYGCSKLGLFLDLSNDLFNVLSSLFFIQRRPYTSSGLHFY